MAQKKWMIRRSKVDVAQVASDMGISTLTAATLLHRGIRSQREAETFLNGDLSQLSDARLLKDLPQGVETVFMALKQGKRIAIYGDYDVDGVTSTTILYRSLRQFTDQVSFHVPHRQKDGYGLQKAAVEQLSKDGVELIITCDNGIAALEEADLAYELGMQLVILDHHEPVQRAKEDGTMEVVLPKAEAVIDHKRPDCPFPFKAMCAGGLAFRFVQALYEAFGRGEAFRRTLEQELLILAAIATVCDIVDLTGDNRILVKEGLAHLPHTANLGLQALLEETGLQGKKINEYALGFVIGPCINATGRLETAAEAIRLLTTDDWAEAKELAAHLAALNEERKEMTTEAFLRLSKRVEEEGYEKDRVLVLYDETVHESVAGIVAGRLKEAYYRPTLVLTAAEGGGAKGSGRSIEGYDLFLELCRVQSLFTRFGGHTMAAGLSLPKENIPVLRQKLNEACTLTEEQLTPLLRLEAVATLDQVTVETAEELQRLSPFGKENPAPLFGSRHLYAERVYRMGKKKDMLRFVLRDTQTGVCRDGVDFQGYASFLEQLETHFGPDMAEKVFAGREGVYLDLVYSIEKNEFQGRTTAQLNIKDLRVYGGGNEG